MKTFDELFEAYLQHLRAVNYSAETLVGVRRMAPEFTRWLQAVHGIATPDRLHEAHLRGYQAHLNARLTARGLPLKSGTLNNHVKAIRQWLRFLYRDRYTVRDLSGCLEHVREPQLLPASVLDHAEVRTVLDRLDTATPLGYRNRTVLELLYSSGLRAGELLGLTAAAVDLADGLVRVLGKGGKERVVPTGATARRFLEGYLRAIRPFWPGSRANAALFLSKRGRPLDRNTLAYLVRRNFVGAPVRVTPHTFRRSCATELIRNNANVYHVKELLGHASLASLRPYTRLTINDLRKTHAKCHPREKDEARERGRPDDGG